jgi:hypothetical protein
MSRSRSKRLKFYRIPTSNQIRHTSFTISSRKTSVQNSFVNLSHCDPPNGKITVEPIQDPVNLNLEEVDEGCASLASQLRVSFVDIGVLMTQQNSKDEGLTSWTSERDKYLAELITLEGRGSSILQEHCISCDVGGADYLCSDCFTDELFCAPCLASAHHLHPFHIIKVCILV